MKRPTNLLERILLDAGSQLNLAVDRDCATIRSRFESEGMSFLTITLPSLDSALIQALALGRITPSMFQGFKPMKRGGNLPALMSGFFMRIFETDGALKDEPCLDSIEYLRVVLSLYKKLEIPCTAARNQRAFERYKSNDASVFSTDQYQHVCDSDFRAIAGYLWSDLEILSGELYCTPGRFGSGATAEKLSPKGRLSLAKWPQRGEHLYPLSVHGSYREDDLDSFAAIELLGESAEQPVRVVGVPKTLKTPRIISIEPNYMMLRQQSVARVLMEWLESGRLGFKSIRFSDQSVNRERARIGSVDGGLATIDLSDASDLVSNDLVKAIFRSCPSFLEYIEAARSTKAQMPDGEIVSLRKYASMGSALCFPVEAMVFFTIVVMAIVKHSGRRPSRSRISEIAATVSVYGDDIIVPTSAAATVMEYLEAFGLKVNRDKSFSTGFFRESCGGDYYKGHNVRPCYLKRFDFSGNTPDPNVLIQYTTLSNSLYMKGLWNACQYIRDHVEKIYGVIPRSRSEIGCVSFASVIYDTRLRYDTRTSGYRVKGISLVSRKEPDRVSDLRGAMLYTFGSSVHKYGLSPGADHTLCGGPRNGPLLLRGEEHQSRFQDDRIHRIRFQGSGRNVPLLGDGIRRDTWTLRSVNEGGILRCLSDYGLLQGGDDASRSYLREDALAFLESIRVKSGSDTEESAMPHAIKMKRGWSQSLAGLTW